MGTYRCTYTMRQFDRRWRYVFYKEGANASAVLDSMHLNLFPLIDVHSPTAIVERVSAANINGQRRDHRSKRLNFSDVAHTSPEGGPDVTNTSAVLELFTAEGDSRKISLSGLHDVEVARALNGADTPTPQMSGQLSALLVWIIDQQFEIQVSQRPVPNTEWAWKPVSLLQPEPNTGSVNTLVSTLENHGWPKGQAVTFKFDSDDTVLLGFANDHKILDNAPDDATDEFTVNVRYRASGASYTPNGMLVRKVGYEYNTIQSGSFHSFQSRQRGSSGGPRGRDRARSFRH